MDAPQGFRWHRRKLSASVALEPATAQAVAEEAEARGVSVSEVLRECVVARFPIKRRK